MPHTNQLSSTDKAITTLKNCRDNLERNRSKIDKEIQKIIELI